jgi:hypothetical protein
LHCKISVAVNEVVIFSEKQGNGTKTIIKFDILFDMLRINVCVYDDIINTKFTYFL